MADISKVTLPDNETHNLKDSKADYVVQKQDTGGQSGYYVVYIEPKAYAAPFFNVKFVNNVIAYEMIIEGYFYGSSPNWSRRYCRIIGCTEETGTVKVTFGKNGNRLYVAFPITYYPAISVSGLLSSYVQFDDRRNAITIEKVSSLPGTAVYTQTCKYPTPHVRPKYIASPVDDVTLQGTINTLRANRLAFLPADQIIIEKTTDGGTTWEDAGFSDWSKTSLFSETRPSIALPLLDGKKSPLCGLRVTFTAMKYNVPAGTPETEKYNYWSSDYVKSTERYTQLKEMYFWVSVSGSPMGVTCEKARGKSPETWVTVFDEPTYNMAGYSGNDYIKLDVQDTFGGGTTQTSNYWNYRVTFFTKEPLPSGSYLNYSQAISEIRGYGDTWWTKGNEYMANDKLYTHDSEKNATFPAKVTATEFSGVVNATTATGTLPVAHGGTGATTASGASNNLLSGLPDWTAVPTDDTKLIRRDTAGSPSFGQVKFSTIWSYIKNKTDTLYQVIRSNSSYLLNSAKYVGGSTPNKYARIKIPNISEIWTMLYMEVSIRGDHDNGYGGKVLINTYHNATSPYTWLAFKAAVIGVLPKTVAVYGSDGQYIYVKMPGATYQNASVDKMLIGDGAAQVDVSNVVVDFVDALPTTYQTATMQFYATTSDIPTKTSDLTNDSGFITTETDPTVPAWAKASTKPTYTASEVGAVPTSRTVNGKALSSNISLTASDVGALGSNGDASNTTATFTQATSRNNIATGTTIATAFSRISKWLADLGSLAFKSSVAKTDLASDVQTSLGKADTALQSYTETDPTVPSWAKASTKPTYTASEVGALPSTTPIPAQVSKLYTATCPTAAGTAAKVATLDDSTGFSLAAGVRVAVTFTYGNTATTPTLNVSSSGAKTIAIPSSATAFTTGNGTTYNTWGAYETVVFTYTGTYWTHDTSGRLGYLAYSGLSSKANTASPALTGTPTAPTAANGTNTTQIATTAFVQTAVSEKQTKPTITSTTLSASGWSNGSYAGLQTTYPVASYDIEIEPNGDSITSAQLSAWSDAQIVGSATTNTLKSLGTVPTADIPIVVKVWAK